jgi:hypothetical protein
VKALPLVLLACLSQALPAAAEVYRCSAPGKAISYQQAPCDGSAIQDTLPIPSEFPDHTAARDRLAAREAAADARILERARIDSAERIARDNRLAAQAQAEAERARPAEAEGWYPVFMAPPAPRRMPHRVRPHAPRPIH